MDGTPAPAPPADEPPADPPKEPGFQFITHKALFHLSGPAGPSLNRLVCVAVQIGAEVRRTGENLYSLSGGSRALVAYADWINAGESGHQCVIDAPTGVAFGIEYANPPRAVRRVAIGGDGSAHHYVRHAIDNGLTATAGPSAFRYYVEGTTAQLIRWLMAALKKTREEVLAMLGIDEATAAAEDRVALDPHAVRVQLPARVTTSDIKHDQQGRIVSVTQIEKSEG